MMSCSTSEGSVTVLHYFAAFGLSGRSVGTLIRDIPPDGFGLIEGNRRNIALVCSARSTRCRIFSLVEPGSALMRAATCSSCCYFFRSYALRESLRTSRWEIQRRRLASVTLVGMEMATGICTCRFQFVGIGLA
jgi:hypothetical protein